MSYNSDPLAPILIAIPDEWQNMISEFLVREGYPVLTASSLNDARRLIQSRSLRGLITVSDWAMTSEDGKVVGLMEAARGKIPSVTLIRKTESYRWFDEVFEPPFHEYCTIPFGLDELLNFMRRANMIPRGD